jgi:hypothetical protein
MPQSSTARRLAQGAVPTSAGSVYTVDTALRAILSSVSFTANNASSFTYTIQMWIVPSGGSRQDSNKVLHETITRYQTYRESQIGIVLEPGDQIHLLTSAGTISYFISGAELTDV